MVCPYCKSAVTQEDIFCPSCDSRLHAPRDFLSMTVFSPIDSMLTWIEKYREGKYTLGRFQTRLSWLIEAMRLQKEQFETMVPESRLTATEAQTRNSFMQIIGLMLDALEKADDHLKQGEDELLKASLVTIYEVHNRLHELKETMEQTFSKEELQGT